MANSWQQCIRRRAFYPQTQVKIHLCCSCIHVFSRLSAQCFADRQSACLPVCLCVCLSAQLLMALLCSSGYGYYRPNVTLFDPGWRGEQTKGPEDSEWGVVDLGNDPIGVADRYLLPLALLCSFLLSLLPRPV